MTLTIEELKYGAEVGDLGIDAVRAVCAEALANREAQPVGYFVRHRSAWDRPSKWRLWTECSAEDYAEFLKIIATGDADAGRFYEARILYDAPPAPANAQPVLYASEETLAYAKEGEKSLVTWSEPMGDAVIPLYTAPQAPAVNAAPDFEAWFVEKYKQPERLFKNEDGGYKFSGVQMAFSAWSDGRAAMLAQPVTVSQGYTLPDGWIACSERMPTPFVDVIASDGKQTICAHVIEDRWWCIVSETAEEPGPIIFWMPLPAAPEGGNDHDTRR